MNQPRLRLAVVVLCLVSTLAWRVRGDDLPTQQEAHQMFKDGQYQPLLQKLSRILALKGPAAIPYDQIDLTILRGETFLQLKQQARAVEAYQAAQKLLNNADPRAVRDPKLAEEQRRTVRAMLLLMSRSQGLQFTPRLKSTAPNAPAGPFSLLDLEQRKPAFAALRDDLEAELKPKVAAAKSATSLMPMIDVLRAVLDLRGLEQLTSGDTKISDGMVKDIASHAGDLMTAEIARADKSDAAIDRTAHENVMVYVPSQTGSSVSSTSGRNMTPMYKLKGLNPQDKKALTANIDTLVKIDGVAREFSDLGSETADFKKIEADSTKAAEKANTTLNADYSKTFNKPQ